MKHRFLFALVALLLVGRTQPGRAQLVINELMQSNIDCIMDDLNEFPDSWVEVYNAGTSTVNLNQYRLGLTDNAGEAYVLPSRNVGAHQYALIYCDKAATGLHTNFRLDSGKGGSVYLFQGTTVADQVTNLKKQPAPNIAYGRQTDGGSAWGYQATPTPGAANCGKICTKILGEPVFSEPGRVITRSGSVSLTLSLPSDAPAGTVIRYTVDGKEPTADSPLYTAPLKIAGTLAVRAKLFCDGYLSPRSTTHSYIYFLNPRSQFTYTSNGNEETEDIPLNKFNGATINSDGTATFNGTTPWGWFSVWYGGADWSGYSELVVELAQAASITTQLVVMYSSGSNNSSAQAKPGTTTIRLTLDSSQSGYVSQIALQNASAGSFRVKRVYLVKKSPLNMVSTGNDGVLTLPVISIVTNGSYLTDAKIGIYVDGSYSSSSKNYEHNWRRPINIEYFEGSGTSSILNQLCETRIQGGASRGSALKSMVVYANKRFGTKRLAHEFFPDQRPGVTDFKSLILRNAGNDYDYLYMRDAVIQRTMAEHVDLDWQAWRPAIVYINGSYKGILNIRERSNEDNIYTHYDGLEDIDMVENWSELKEGDWDNYNRFTEFYTETGHSLAEYEQWMDWKEFINLMVMNLYYNNQDFPGNNIVMWRPRTAEGKWRWIAKDTDFGLGLYGSSATYQTIRWLYNPNYDADRAWANSEKHTRLFRRLMDDADFRRELIDRAAIYMGDFMNSKGTRAVWDPMYEMIKTEYPFHRKLINEWWPNYAEELNSARTWVVNRTNSFYQQLASYYSLGTPTEMTVNKELGADGLNGVPVTFNGVPLSEGVFDGKFFVGRSVSLSGTHSEGKEVTGWTITRTQTNGTTSTTTYNGSTYTFTMPSCKSLAINAVLGTYDGIDSRQSLSWKWRIAGNQLALTDVPAGTRIWLFDTQGILLQQRVADGNETHLPLSGHRFYVLKVGSETVKIYQ